MAQHDDEGPLDHAFDRRSMLRKLAVGGSIVWASPMIASRASALLPPSQCVNGVELNWTDIFPNTTPDFGNGPAVLTDIEGSGVDITISSVIEGTVALPRNFEVQDSPHGGITGKSLRFDQRPVPNTPNAGGTAQAGGQTITISFSTTVRNISFTVTDIDNLTDDGDPFWSDRITTITAPTSAVLGGNVWGTGGTGNGTGGSNGSGNGGNSGTNGAYRNSIDSQNLADTSGLGNLTLNYAGPIDTVSFRWWCGGVGAGINESNQRINLSNITFDTCPEGVTPNFAPLAPVQSELRVPADSDELPAPPTPGVD